LFEPANAGIMVIESGEGVALEEIDRCRKPAFHAIHIGFQNTDLLFDDCCDIS
jgi:hypothetical protein